MPVYQLTLPHCGVAPTAPINDLGCAESIIYIGRRPSEIGAWARTSAYADVPDTWSLWWAIYDRDGYALDVIDEPTYVGRNVDGYDREGYDLDGRDEGGRDRDGYDEDGYDEGGRDRDGYDETGYDEGGRDRDGYDQEGYDENGEDCYGRTRHENDECDCACRDCHDGDDFCTCGTCGHTCDCHDDDGCRRCQDNIPAYHDSDHDEIRESWGQLPGELIGVELETEIPDVGRAYADRPPFVIGERDGSLDSRRGVEWIGEPMPFSAYVENGKWDLWVKRLANRHNARSWDTSTCGMHVNLTKGTIEVGDQAKFVLFIHDNQELSEIVAGRKECQWALYHKKTIDNAAQESSKYQAVRVGHHVLEVRIFKGTLNPSSFRKNIQYCHSVLQFARSAKDLVDLTKANYLTFIQANSAEYADLVQFLTNKGII